MSRLSLKNIHLIKCDQPIRVKANEEWWWMWNVTCLRGMFERAALLQPFRLNLSWQKVCVCVCMCHCVLFFSSSFFIWVCVFAVDEEGVVSSAPKAPYLGHFSPDSGELLTTLLLSTHINKQRCHAINTSGQNSDADWQLTTAETCTWAAVSKWLLPFYFIFFVCRL